MLNEIRIIGNVGADPDIRHTQGGPVANISVATEENWRDKSGEWQSKTSWHRVVAFGFPATYIDRYIRKGMQVFVAGSMQYGSYEKEGHTVYTAEVKAQKVKILGKKDQQGGPSGYQSNTGDDISF